MDPVLNKFEAKIMLDIWYRILQYISSKKDFSGPVEGLIVALITLCPFARRFPVFTEFDLGQI